MTASDDVKAVRARYRMLRAVLDERSQRIFAAAEALALGRGGIAAVVRATKVSRSTVSRGIRDVEDGVALEEGRIRRPGGGRKRARDLDPSLANRLEDLIEPSTRGDPMSRLRWTCKSTRVLATELSRRGPAISARDRPGAGPGEEVPQALQPVGHVA